MRPTKEGFWILEATQRGDALTSEEIAGRIREQFGEDISARTIGGVISSQLTNRFRGDSSGGGLKTWRRIR